MVPKRFRQVKIVEKTSFCLMLFRKKTVSSSPKVPMFFLNFVAFSFESRSSTVDGKNRSAAALFVTVEIENTDHPKQCSKQQSKSL